MLEPRWLMAQAVLVDQQFRSDDFSISGTYSYELRSPSNHDYIDKITNGPYASSSGHVDWTSPTESTGFLEGKATGAGHDTVIVGRSRIGCSDYSIEDIGRFEFSVDASQSKLWIDSANATSTRYTSYKDLLGGQCPAPNPPWSRFFGGQASLYNGTFKTSNHTVAISYASSGANPMTVTSPAATVKWTTTAPTDFALQASIAYPEPAIPDGWIAIDQTASVTPVSYLDPESGNVALTATMQGKPLTTATPATPMANIRLFWANSTSDTSGSEIPITSNLGPVGLYWNSKQLDAALGSLPNPPAGATFVRVLISAPAGADANAGNNSVYLPVGAFEVVNASSGPVTAGDPYDGSSSSLLDAVDRADPDIRVLAYNPQSLLGGDVEVLDDTGAFYYKPSATAPEILALAVGETVSDQVTFRAIKNQTVVDQATHTFLVAGVNDPPVAGADQAATTNDQRLTLSASSLVANDSDPDHNDSISLTSVASDSAYGATVYVLRDSWTGKIKSVVYDPSTSPILRALAVGATLEDQFEYTITDGFGLPTTGTVAVTVTGVSLTLEVHPIATQLMRQDTSSSPITVQILDPDGDASDVQVSAVASNGVLVPAGQLVIDGSGDTRTLVITPAAGLSGKTRVTVTATDSAAHTAQTEFLLIVGTSTDLDLDGVSDTDEDGAPNLGDMNNDGTLDSYQPNVASGRAATGDHYFQLVVDEPLAFELVSVRDGSGDPASPAETQFPLGIVHYEVVLPLVGSVANIGFRTTITATPVNRYLHLPPTHSWTDGMYSLGYGALVYTDHLLITAKDGGACDDGAAGDSRISADGGFANVTFPWRGPNPLDVDNDGNVIPQDALILINEINVRNSRDLPPLPPAGVTIPIFFDPSGDNFLAPLDALQIINYLNTHPLGSAEGEAWDAVGGPSSVSDQAPASARPSSVPLDRWSDFDPWDDLVATIASAEERDKLRRQSLPQRRPPADSDESSFVGFP